MLQSLISIKLAVMVAALGLDTNEWQNASPEMNASVTALAKAQSDAIAGKPEASKTLQDTINNIKELADKKNDKDALFAMGLFLQQSNQQGSLPQALEYYKKAADLNQLQAMNNYGFLIAASTQDPEQAKQGISWIKKASDAGLNAARRNMASIYLRGMAGETQDVAAAEKLLDTASKSKTGDPQADFELAQFYSGAGGEAKKDDKKAYEYLTKASDAGNPNALASLGALLFEGKSLGGVQVPKNPTLAVEKFKQLAAQKVPAGLRTMGELHESGLAGVEKNFETALKYYTEAAQGNDAAAQVRLASFYDLGVDLPVTPDGKGDGKPEVIRNDAAALQLYRMAAQNNVPLAMYNVGTFYESGRGVDKDPAKAFAYFLQSAVSGFPYGMQKAGVYYLNGAGVSKDPVAAAGWFARGSAAGLPDSSLSSGIVTEMGVSTPDAKTPPGFVAAGLYSQAADSVAASDAVRMEALLRLGNLYFRGVVVPTADSPPKPNYERAYIYFKHASKIDPSNALAAKAADEAKAKLTVAEKTKAEGDVERREADLKSRKAQAANPQAAATSAPAAPAATPAAPPAATPVTPRIRTPNP